MRLLARHMLHKAANGPLEKANTERRRQRQSRGLKSSGGVAREETGRTERGEKWVTQGMIINGCLQVPTLQAYLLA